MYNSNTHSFLQTSRKLRESDIFVRKKKSLRMSNFITYSKIIEIQKGAPFSQVNHYLYWESKNSSRNWGWKNIHILLNISETINCRKKIEIFVYKQIFYNFICFIENIFCKFLKIKTLTFFVKFYIYCINYFSIVFQILQEKQNSAVFSRDNLNPLKSHRGKYKK